MKCNYQQFKDSSNFYSKEKLSVFTLINMIVIFSAYALYVYYNYVVGSPEIINEPKFWGKTFLVLIPITIVAQIVMHIIFAIVNKILTNQNMPTVNDERDKLIELKSIRISHWIFTFGFMLSMGSLALGMQLWLMFILLIASGLAAGIVSELAKIYFYKRGF